MQLWFSNFSFLESADNYWREGRESAFFRILITTMPGSKSNKVKRALSTSSHMLQTGVITLKVDWGDDMFCNHCSLECYVSVFIKIYFPPETSAPLLLLLSYASSAHTFFMWDSESGRQ